MEYIIMPQWLTETLGILVLLGIFALFIVASIYLLKQTKIDTEKKIKLNKAIDIFIRKSQLEMRYIDSQLEDLYKNYQRIGGTKKFDEFTSFIYNLDFTVIENLGRHLFDNEHLFEKEDIK